MQRKSPASSKHSKIRASVHSPNSKPKKLVTRQTTKTATYNTQRISPQEIVKTSYTNTVTQVTQQFKNRPNLMKKITKTDLISQTKETINQYEAQPVHKYVKTIEHSQTTRENKNGKIIKQKKTVQNEFEETLSDDDEDIQEIQQKQMSSFRIEHAEQSNLTKHRNQDVNFAEEFSLVPKKQSVEHQKASALRGDEKNASTISIDYQKMLKKFSGQDFNGDDIMKSIPDKEKIQFVKNLMDPEFKKRNIIRAPHFSSETESEADN